MLCLAEFLDFGPEILTRDLNQAQKNSGGRMQKKKEKIDALFPTSSFSRNFGPAIGGQFCFCFFASDFQCVAELVSNHVSKYQVQTPKIGRDIAILSRSGPLARPSSYSIWKYLTSLPGTGSICGVFCYSVGITRHVKPELILRFTSQPSSYTRYVIRR